VHLIRYAGDIDIIGRNKISVSEVYEELKDRAQ
jgi:hypothetical protein